MIENVAKNRMNRRYPRHGSIKKSLDNIPFTRHIVPLYTSNELTPKPLSPPDYPDQPDAPLSAFGPSFVAEISRSTIAVVLRPNSERPEEGEVRVAASLTMLEAFEPEDQLQCMIAAQGIGFHMAAMDNLALAIQRHTSPEMAIKYHPSASRMQAAFSRCVHDVRKLQGRPLPTGSGGSRPAGPRPKPTQAAPRNAEDTHAPPESRPPTPPSDDPVPDQEWVEELPSDVVTRPQADLHHSPWGERAAVHQAGS